MSDTTAIRHVLDGYRADITRRTDLIGRHRATVAELEAANASDARHAEVAEALIETITTAGSDAAWRISGDMEAAAMVAEAVLIGGMPGQGKTMPARMLATLALLDAQADIADDDGPEAAALVHDHDPNAAHCPACLLTGHGHVLVLDGIGGKAR